MVALIKAKEIRSRKFEFRIGEHLYTGVLTLMNFTDKWRPLAAQIIVCRAHCSRLIGALTYKSILPSVIHSIFE